MCAPRACSYRCMCAWACMFTWTCVCLEARCWCRVSSPVALHCVSLPSTFHGSSSIWVGWPANELQGSTCLGPAPLPAPGIQMCVSTPTFYAGNGNLSLGSYAGTTGTLPTKPARIPMTLLHVWQEHSLRYNVFGYLLFSWGFLLLFWSFFSLHFVLYRELIVMYAVLITRL